MPLKLTLQRTVAANAVWKPAEVKMSNSWYPGILLLSSKSAKPQTSERCSLNNGARWTLLSFFYATPN